MTYCVLIDALAQRDIDDFYEYLRRYSENAARKYLEAFYDAIDRTIATFPHSFSFFAEVGAPYRGHRRIFPKEHAKRRKHIISLDYSVVGAMIKCRKLVF